MLISCLAGIAADNYSHLPYFGGRRDAYDDYYDIVVDIGEVAVPEFATRVQELLVDYLRETYGDGPADWCREVLERRSWQDVSRACMLCREQQQHGR